MDVSAVRRGRISRDNEQTGHIEICPGLGWQEQDPERKPSIHKDAAENTEQKRHGGGSTAKSS